MNYFKIILFLCLIVAGNEALSSQAPQANDAQQPDAYFIQEVSLRDNAQKNLTRISVKLFKRFGALSKEIGSANLNYFSDENRVYLDSLGVNEKYRNMLLGSYLFKYAIAYCQRHVNISLIDWDAVPSGSLAETNAQGLEKLLNFYKKAGSIVDSIDVPNIRAEMHYPIRSAHMLATLMPILEPKVQNKNDKQIVLANGSTYATSKSDVLSIIANYIGESNE